MSWWAVGEVSNDVQGYVGLLVGRVWSVTGALCTFCSVPSPLHVAP